MITIESTSLSFAIYQTSLCLIQQGFESRIDGIDNLKLKEPLIISIIDSSRICPWFTTAANPFESLLSPLTWIFQKSSSSSFPNYLASEICVWPSFKIEDLAAQIITGRRSVVVFENQILTFEVMGEVGESGVLTMNIVEPICDIQTILPQHLIRYSLIFQAVASMLKMVCGKMRVFVLYPVVGKQFCEEIQTEYNEYRDCWNDSAEVSIPAVGNPICNWIHECRMFVDEHVHAMGYRDRSIRSLYSPSMTTWLRLSDSDASDPVGDAKRAVEEVRDSSWRNMMNRYLDQVSVARSS